LGMALRRMLIAQRRRSHTEVSASKPVSTAIAAAIMTIAAVGRQVYADDAATAIRPSGELARRIQEELDHEASHERLWWNTSMAAYGGLTVGQGVAGGQRRLRHPGGLGCWRGYLVHRRGRGC
jgi:hypothetical protein